MTKRDWLLLLLGYKGAGGPALDPVRVQKGMFLFAQEGAMPSAEKYSFKPYNYGPYSSTLRADVDGLVRDGLVEEIRVQGYSWSKYKLNEAGLEEARRLLKNVTSDDAKQLYAIKQDITSVSFNELLRDVYRRYPEFAERSVFNS